MLKEAISPQLRLELVVRDGGLLSPLRNRRQVLEIFQQLFIICDREHDSRFLAGLISEILQGFAHAKKMVLQRRLVEPSNGSNLPRGTSRHYHHPERME